MRQKITGPRTIWDLLSGVNDQKEKQWSRCTCITSTSLEFFDSGLKKSLKSLFENLVTARTRETKYHFWSRAVKRSVGKDTWGQISDIQMKKKVVFCEDSPMFSGRLLVSLTKALTWVKTIAYQV